MQIGHARVPTAERPLDIRLDATKRAGCGRLLTDDASTATGDGPCPADALPHFRPGDVPAARELDRPGRPSVGLVETVTDVQGRGVRSRSLTRGIDTASPACRSCFDVTASQARIGRWLPADRTRAGGWTRRGGGVGGRERRLAPREVARDLVVSAPTLFRPVPASTR